MQGQFLGFVSLNATIYGVVQFRNGSNTPTNPTGTPSFRVFGPNGYVGQGTLSQRNTGSISGATKANPCVVTTSAAHNLITGSRVSISGVSGMTQLNGNDYTVAVLSSTTFSLDSTDSSAYGTYTSGGTWAATGLYYFSITPTYAGGYDVDQRYDVVVAATVSSVAKGDTYSFQVA